jgi:hypothetical protein
MSLTSYRAAPPRDGIRFGVLSSIVMKDAAHATASLKDIRQYV